MYYFKSAAKVESLKGLNVVIIGAGAAGIVATKYLVESGAQVQTFEQSEELGGSWVYTDDVGKNKYGLPVPNPMYKGLR